MDDATGLTEALLGLDGFRVLAETPPGPITRWSTSVTRSPIGMECKTRQSWPSFAKRFPTSRSPLPSLR